MEDNKISDEKSEKIKKENIKPEAHPEFHSDSKKYGIHPKKSNQASNIKDKAHPNFHEDSEKYIKKPKD